MTLNLTELRDEPLGKHPIHAFVCAAVCSCFAPNGLDLLNEQDVVAADTESVFKSDVDGLSDEALDPAPAQEAFGGGCTGGPQLCGWPSVGANTGVVSDEALDAR